MRGRQVYEVFKSSDVYVMPSVSEPLWYLSHSKLCNAVCRASFPKQSGCAEILDYAIKVDYWDVDALADAIYALITYPALHQFLRKKKG